MKNVKSRIEISHSWIAQFCKTHHIIKLALFGSVLTDNFSDKSDIDILVEFDPQHIPGLFSFVRMKEEISEKLGRKIDLRTPEDINKLFRNEVLQQSHLIYGQERFNSA